MFEHRLHRFYVSILHVRIADAYTCFCVSEVCFYYLLTFSELTEVRDAQVYT
jgi:hypothetical protein